MADEGRLEKRFPVKKIDLIYIYIYIYIYILYLIYIYNFFYVAPIPALRIDTQYKQYNKCILLNI